MTPTSRSLKWLKDAGYHVAKLERWNPWAKIRQDIWGADLLALFPKEKEIVERVSISGWKHDVEIRGKVSLIQVTTTSNMSAREKKIRQIPEAMDWVQAGHRFIIHGWSKKGPRGKRKTWQLTEKEITL